MDEMFFGRVDHHASRSRNCVHVSYTYPTLSLLFLILRLMIGPVIGETVPEYVPEYWSTVQGNFA